MQWIGKRDEMDPTEWCWDVQGEKLVPLMMDKNPAPDSFFENDQVQLLNRMYYKEM